MGISASSELGRAILRKRPDILASTAKAERDAKREALTWRGIVFRSKAELAYAHRLDALKGAGHIVRWDYEAVAFRLSSGKVYWPDFRVVVKTIPTDPIGIRWPVEHHEVKRGAAHHMREREGLTKLDWAAQRWTEETFYLARLSRGGDWDISEVRP